MPKNSPANWMICYDISNERRLQAVHRLVSRRAVRIQYSVYYMQATDQVIDDFMKLLGGIINHKEDDIRVYPLPDDPAAYSLGHDSVAGALLKAGGKGSYLVIDGDDTA